MAAAVAASAERALVIAPAWVGDAVMAEPLLARLREKYPAMTIDALSPAWVAPVMSRMPEIGRVHLSSFAHGELLLLRRFALGRSLKGYTRAYVLPNSLKSALIPFFAGIPRRVGFTGEARYGLINIRHILDKNTLPRMVERFVRLAEEPGEPLPKKSTAPFILTPSLTPRLISTPEQRWETLHVLGQSLGLDEKDRASAPAPIIFCPGAEYGAAKRWPVRHFAALAEMLLAALPDAPVWILGSGRDRAVGEAILTGLSPATQARCRNLCGQTTLDQAIDLIALSRLVVCNDSGLMHVAAAVSRPLVALFGSSSPEFTPPLSEKARIMRLDLPCSPCFKRECPLKHLECLERLLPEQIFAVCQSLLA